MNTEDHSSDKISIIVPVYNTAKYLNSCIESIVNQTYFNLEILLIDDGSTDKSLQLCKKYAKKDRRISVIEKSNGGVSSARNLGIKIATGDYITFIDSDDQADYDLISFLHKTLLEQDGDISICGARTRNSGHEAITLTENQAVILTKAEAIKELLYQKRITNSVFGKLYKMCLFESISFREDTAYGEDLEINYRLFTKASVIVLNSAKKYYYLQRNDSAMNTAFNPSRMDSLDVAEKIYMSISKKQPLLVHASESKLLTEALSIVWRIPSRDTEFTNARIICEATIKRYAKDVLEDNEVKFQNRIYAAIALLNVKLLVAFFKLRMRFAG